MSAIERLKEVRESLKSAQPFSQILSLRALCADVGSELERIISELEAEQKPLDCGHPRACLEDIAVPAKTQTIQSGLTPETAAIKRGCAWCASLEERDKAAEQRLEAERQK